MARVPRQRRGGTGRATLRPIAVDIYVQSFPGTDAAAGVQGIDYEVRSPVRGAAPRNGSTGADGKIRINLWAGRVTTLVVMGSEYRLRPRRRLEPLNTTRGLQRRLNMLGYNAGTVDGGMGPNTEYAILNFQADNAPLKVDGLVGPQTRNKLRELLGE